MFSYILLIFLSSTDIPPSAAISEIAFIALLAQNIIKRALGLSNTFCNTLLIRTSHEPCRSLVFVLIYVSKSALNWRALSSVHHFFFYLSPALFISHENYMQVSLQSFILKIHQTNVWLAFSSEFFQAQ